jgi:flagellar hook protein FlgE
MGIFDALTTAVGGLQAQSFALQNISGNIANSQTTGFKETDTSFDALVQAAAAGQQTSGSVLAESVATNTVQGSIQSSSVATNLAINGKGWFVVAQPTSFSDNQPVFSGVTDYTRRGDFQQNQGGYLVNGAGYYLMGIPVNAQTGNPVGSVPQVLQFNNNFIPAQATTQIQYKANLAATPTTATSSSTIPGSELLNPVGFTANPLVGAPAAARITGTGASLAPDAEAVGTSTVTLSGTPASSTPLSSLGFSAGPPATTFTVSDGTNTTTYTYAAGDTVANLISAINSGAAGNALVSASINSSNQLVLTGTDPNFVDGITVGGTGAAGIGFGTSNNSFLASNLLTQSAVSSGQTLTIATQTPPGAATTDTVTFGTASGDVASLAQLKAKLQSFSNVNATVSLSNGNITMTAANSTDQITIGGSASAAKFGITNLLAVPANGTVIAADVQTFTNESIAGGSVTGYDSTGNPVNVQLRWAKTASVATGGTDTWQLFYQINSNATGTASAWKNVGTAFTFDATGQLSPPISSLTLPNLTVNGDSLGSVQLVFGQQRFDPVRGYQRHRPCQPVPAERFRGRPIAIDLGQWREPGGRRVLQRPEHPARPNRAGELQWRKRAAGAERRRLRGHRGIRRAAVLGDRADRRQLARGLQRRYRDPVQSSDRGAAGLFGQRQGDDDRKPDDPEPVDRDPVMPQAADATKGTPLKRPQA